MSSNRSLFQRHLAKTNRFPLDIEIDYAEGIFLYQPDGSTIIDLISGICVSNLGHRHPDIVAAVKDQCDRYMHTMVYGELVLSPQVQLAKRLTSLLPDHLNSCYFTTSGSEAVEGALKLAKRYTGRSGLIACTNAYHGSSHGALSLMSDDYYTAAYRPLLPDIQHIVFNDVSSLNIISDQTAAVIVETIQAEAGVRKPEAGFLQALRKTCNEHGTLLIFDEIQVGSGRTGKMFAFENYDVEPDILLLAKGMGGGMPLGCFIAQREVMDSLTHHPALGHITTFGGHPVCCAAALKTVEIISESGVLESIEPKSRMFEKLLGDHHAIREIRRAGLLIAVEVKDPSKASSFIERCMTSGFLMDFFLWDKRSFRIAPPLNITVDEIEMVCTKLRTLMDDHF